MSLPNYSQVCDYLRAISRAKGVLNTATAATRLGTSPREFCIALRYMEQGGMLKFEARVVENRDSRIYRITAPRDMETLWSAHVEERAPNKPRAPEIEKRRAAVERKREEHQRYWLERERAPRGRSQPAEFIDKATALALQGLSA